MSKAKILNQVIETSTAMNCMCSEVAKCISPQRRKNSHSGRTDAKHSTENAKHK